MFCLKNLLFFTIISFTISCNSLISKKWLLGTWQQSVPNGILYEKWTKINAQLYKGEGYCISNKASKDTLFYESMVLEKRGKDTYFIPTVKDQNKGQAVEFKQIKQAKKNCIFENKEHDFPQRIEYYRQQDTLIAHISGQQNGKIDTLFFKFIRQ